MTIYSYHVFGCVWTNGCLEREIYEINDDDDDLFTREEKKKLFFQTFD